MIQLANEEIISNLKRGMILEIYQFTPNAEILTILLLIYDSH